MVAIKFESVTPSVLEYANAMPYLDSAGSFWGMLERACHGAYHQGRRKYLNRYVASWV